VFLGAQACEQVAGAAMVDIASVEQRDEHIRVERDLSHRTELRYPPPRLRQGSRRRLSLPKLVVAFLLRADN
jgi:hypothetical protein